MAVFTTLTDQEAAGLLSEFDIGEFRTLEPIAGGIENTNYFLDTTQGRWVLTVFERLSAEQLPFYLKLTAHLKAAGLPVAAPVRTREGSLFSTVKGKPFAVANRLSGASVVEVTPAECADMGRVLARMHLAAADFPLHQDNLRGPQWWKEVVPQLLPHLGESERAMLEEELAHQIALFADPDFQALPQAACHCDLFRNNAMIEGHGTAKARVCGVFDFYFAGCTPLVYDIAVTVNDWCTAFDDPELSLEAEKTGAFLTGYESVRPLWTQEKAVLSDMLRAGALRFWISRLFDVYMPREATLLKPHDPTYFEKILRSRRSCALPFSL